MHKLYSNIRSPPKPTLLPTRPLAALFPANPSPDPEEGKTWFWELAARGATMDDVHYDALIIQGDPYPDSNLGAFPLQADMSH